MEEDGREEMEGIEEIDLRRWRMQESKKALKKTKPGKEVRVESRCSGPRPPKSCHGRHRK